RHAAAVLDVAQRSDERVQGVPQARHPGRGAVLFVSLQHHDRDVAGRADPPVPDRAGPDLVVRQDVGQLAPAAAADGAQVPGRAAEDVGGEVAAVRRPDRGEAGASSARRAGGGRCGRAAPPHRGAAGTPRGRSRRARCGNSHPRTRGLPGPADMAVNQEASGATLSREHWLVAGLAAGAMLLIVWLFSPRYAVWPAVWVPDFNSFPETHRAA